MISEALILLVYFFLSLFSISLIGFLISSIFPKSSLVRTSFFVQLFIAIVFIVLSYSLVITRFKTVQIVFLLPIFYYLAKNRDVIRIDISRYDFIQYLNHFKRYSAFALLIFGIMSLTVFDFASNTFQTQHPDFHWYAKFSHGMYFSGHENSIGDMNHFFPNELNGMSPYHYFELWLNAFFANLFSISYVKSLLLIVYPILQFASFLGVFEILRHFNRKEEHKYHYIIGLSAFLLLFTAPIYFNFYEQFDILKYGKGICQTNPMGFSRKYTTIFIFGCTSILFYLNSRIKTSLILLSLIPILSIGTLPGIGLGLCLFFFLNSIINKNWSFIYYSILFLIPSILVLLIYKFNSLDATAGHISDNSIITEFMQNRLNYKAHFFAFLFPFVRSILFCSPFLALIFFGLRTKKLLQLEKNLLLIGLLIVFSGALSAGIAFKLLHSNQLLSNVLPLFNLVIISLFCAKIIDYSKRYFLIIVASLMVFNIYTTYDYLNKENSFFSDSTINFENAFKRKILASIENEKEPKIGYIFADDNFFNMTIEQHRTPLAFVNFSDSQPVITNLNKCQSYTGYDNFYWPFNFYCKSKPNESYQSQLNGFIRKFKLEYLLIPIQRINDLDLKYKIVTKNNEFLFIRITV